MDKTALAIVALLLVFGLAVFGSAFAGGGEQAPPSRPDKVVKTAEQWKSELSAEEYRILRDKGTERAFTGKYWDDHEPGTYVCAGCGLELFAATDKFDSGTGWPSYTRPIAADRVDSHTDASFGMIRTEVTCARCGGHLGHVFDDGPKPTGKRFCINGNALDKLPATPAPKAP